MNRVSIEDTNRFLSSEKFRDFRVTGPRTRFKAEAHSTPEKGLLNIAGFLLIYRGIL